MVVVSTLGQNLKILAHREYETSNFVFFNICQETAMDMSQAYVNSIFSQRLESPVYISS